MTILTSIIGREPADLKDTVLLNRASKDALLAVIASPVPQCLQPPHAGASIQRAWSLPWPIRRRRPSCCKVGRFIGPALLLRMAIIGGAIVPPFHGKVASLHGLAFALVAPAICYLLSAVYGWLTVRGLGAATPPAEPQA